MPRLPSLQNIRPATLSHLKAAFNLTSLPHRDKYSRRYCVSLTIAPSLPTFTTIDTDTHTQSLLAIQRLQNSTIMSTNFSSTSLTTLLTSTRTTLSDIFAANNIQITSKQNSFEQHLVQSVLRPLSLVWNSSTFNSALLCILLIALTLFSIRQFRRYTEADKLFRVYSPSAFPVLFADVRSRSIAPSTSH